MLNTSDTVYRHNGVGSDQNLDRSLRDLVFDWLENRVPFEVERGVYIRNKAA